MNDYDNGDGNLWVRSIKTMFMVHWSNSANLTENLDLFTNYINVVFLHCKCNKERILANL